MAVPAFEMEMRHQLAQALLELAEASAASDADGIGLAEARVADLIDVAQRQGIEVTAT